MKILKLDIDKGKPDIEQIKFVVSAFSLKVIDAFVHKTTNGYHVRLYVTEPDICDAEVVLFQTLMGSDLKREVFNYLRVLNDKANWNVLFEHKENSKGIIISKENMDKRMTKILRKELK